MADQAERVILEAEDTPVIEAVGRANTALDSFEKKSESSHGKVIRISDQTRTSVQRLIASLEKQADTYGKSGVERLEREASDERTGVFTSNILAITAENHQIALYFTGRQHAGENMADVLKQRASKSPPIQMCDALSRNTPKAAGIEILLANCMAHGRRQFTEIAPNFPAECRYVLESLGEVYYTDAAAREQSLSAEDRLRLHQKQSGPVMEQLRAWLAAQFAEKKTEPNSGLGKAITYPLRHWKGLTAFLRHAGAPLDNNLCEQALKRAVLHRKNALFYRTLNGAQVGDLFMSLIHTCRLCGANSFEYLTELQRHSAELLTHPAEWMP